MEMRFHDGQTYILNTRAYITGRLAIDNALYWEQTTRERLFMVIPGAWY